MKEKIITSKLSIYLLKKYAKFKQSSIVIVTKNKTLHIQKNGSMIETLPLFSNNVRGRRSKHIEFYDIEGINMDEFEEAIRPFTKENDNEN